MTRRQGNLGKIGVGLLATLIVGLIPAAAHAEALVFRNETNGPIIVQAAVVFRGAVRRSAPCLLKPGDPTPPIIMPGDKLVTVYDALHPNVVIFQGTVRGGLTDQIFGVAPDGAGGVKLDLKAAPQGP